MILSDASFSYTNKHASKERFMPKTMKKNAEDDELGIFGAEKYFKGVLDEELLRTSNNNVHCGSNRPREKHEEPCPIPKPNTPSTVRSETSWNSRRNLLVSNGSNANNHSKKTSVKRLLASLGCNCCDKGSVKIIEAKQPVKGGDSSKRADEDVKIKNDTGSDGSSDLFEIESFSANENNLFLAQQATEKNTSVVTPIE